MKCRKCGKEGADEDRGWISYGYCLDCFDKACDSDEKFEEFD